jgi:hypothetical protein
VRSGSEYLRHVDFIPKTRNRVREPVVDGLEVRGGEVGGGGDEDDDGESEDSREETNSRRVERDCALKMRLLNRSLGLMSRGRERAREGWWRS